MTEQELLELFNSLTFDEDGYADLPQSFIENTIMRAKRNATATGIKTFWITPIVNYVLHDNELDMPTIDMDDNETLRLGYTGGTVSCASWYDFAENPREFYAVPRTSVPADQIYGGVTPPAQTE